MVATPEARAAARKVLIQRADARAIALAPVITDIKASGITTPYAIATELARRRIPTARGHRFVIGWLNVPALGTMERY